jgi:hypothetical protein
MIGGINTSPRAISFAAGVLLDGQMLESRFVQQN